jgi:hypothetical protein
MFRSPSADWKPLFFNAQGVPFEVSISRCATSTAQWKQLLYRGDIHNNYPPNGLLWSCFHVEESCFSSEKTTKDIKP